MRSSLSTGSSALSLPTAPGAPSSKMVSHAEVAESHRRASSVTSRSRKNSHAHHHRNRSNFAAAQYTPHNEFPFFTQTGDVEILIACDGQEKRYLLHRLILAQFSGFFNSGMREDWSRTQTTKDVQQPMRDNQLSVIGEESSSSLSAPPVGPEQLISGPQPSKRWRYELDWENSQDDEEPILVQKPPSSDGLFSSSLLPPRPPPIQPRPPPTASRTSFFRSMASLSLNPPQVGHPSQSVANIPTMPMDPVLTNPLLRDYDNLFRIFYNHSPTINSINIASAYSECKSLLTLADTYDALGVVGPRVDHHLLRFSSRLFKQIAKYPPSYLKLGYLARSRIIFSEALTHVVGQWPAGQDSLKPSNHPGSSYEIPINVLDLIEDKVDELEEIKMKIEAKLFRLTITTSRGERVNPTNDYLGWLAMSLWRQWLAENTTPEIRGILKNSPNPAHVRNASTESNGPANQTSATARLQPVPNTGRLYRLIASTDSQSFLSREELKRFLKLYPSSSSSGSLYNRDNMKRFERKMDEIKNVARDIVKPLTRNCLELDIRALSDGQGGGLGYLTCMRVEDGEMPWE